MPNNTLPISLFEDAKSLSNKDFSQRMLHFALYLQSTPYGSPEPSENPKHYETSDEFVDDLCAKHHFVYSFDKLDCVTYVETVLALAYIEPPFTDEPSFIAEFEKNLKAIRYKEGIDTYIFSNHVTSLDWCPNNRILLDDLTKTIDSDCSNAQALVDKTQFFFKTQVEKKFPNATIDYLADKLREISKSYQATKVDFPYLSTETVLEQYDAFVESFPEVSVVNIVRPGWDLVKSIGTQLNVSHQGFVFKVPSTYEEGKQELIFMHATSVDPKKVVQIPLKEYLQKYLDHETIRGINVQNILPQMQAHLKSQESHRGYYLSKIHPEAVTDHSPILSSQSSENTTKLFL